MSTNTSANGPANDIAQSGTQAASSAKAGGSLIGRRFMRRLSIGVKLWITTVILAVPLVALGAFYFKSLQHTLFFTKSEQLGSQLALPLVETSWRVGRHEVLSVAAFQDNAANADIERYAREIDEQLGMLQQVDGKYGSATTHTQLQTVLRAWEAVKSAHPATLKEIVDVHQAAIDAVTAMKSEIIVDWQIVLDPELTSYSILDAAIVKMPEMQLYMSAAQMRMRNLFQHGVYQPEDGAELIRNLGLLQDRLAAAHDEFSSANRGSTDEPADVKQQLAAVGNEWYEPSITWIAQLSEELRSGKPREAEVQKFLKASDAIVMAVDRAQDETQKAADLILDDRASQQTHMAYLALGGAGLALVVALIVMLALVRRIAGAVRRLLHISEEIAKSNFNNRIDESGTDEFSRLFAGMSGMQRQLKSQIEAERKMAEENGRIKAALDKASSKVMLADESFNIIYMNEAAMKLFRDHQQELRRDLPSFDADRLIGSSMDQFHRNPGHQRNVLAGLKGSHSTDAKTGGLTLRITASPVNDASGKRTGTVVEWLDRTAEAKAEEEVASIVSKAVAGNLEGRVRLDDKTGSLQTLGKGLNELLDNMSAMVVQIKTAASEVTRGADEISQGNANLSQRTEEQSSSLEETASSMEEMTSTVKQNADNAGQANQLATAARDQAEKGGAVVGKAVQAMTGINESSRKIADIIGVIDEIAFQTNLLALNAAVEAARAGEQGRGFAVVASEVRNLAGRSATAAKEIKELIQDSVRRVDEGSTLVSQSGQTLDQIVSAVKKVSDIIAEIAAASHEQSDGIEQVNKAVMQLDEMTQQNAALVEQASAASQSMADQARGLNEMMARYQVTQEAMRAHGMGAPVARESGHAAPAAAKPAAERRGAARPWAKGDAPASAPARAPRAAAASGSDAEWKEF